MGKVNEYNGLDLVDANESITVLSTQINTCTELSVLAVPVTYGVYINDDLSEDIELEPVISPDLRTEGLVTVRNSDVDGCKEVAKKIVSQVLHKGVLSLDLTDLRCFDGYTYAHSVNVAVLACIIGFGLKMNEASLEQYPASV